MSELRIVSHATCLGCGCACDDIDVAVEGNRIVEARRACPLGVAWFGDGRVPDRARIGGRDASLEEALDAAARLLGGARRPLVYLAPDVSCEAQREAVALADALHATLDSVTSATVVESVIAAQERGRAGATLGELRNRADLVVFWGVDPAVRYPRYQSRYAPEPVGTHVPGGRSGRTVVAVDVGDERGPADADVRVAVSARDEVATLTAVRAVVAAAGATRAPSHPKDEPLWEQARALAATLLGGRYVALVHDGEPAGGARTRHPDRAGALIALAQALNGPTRCALSTLRAGGNRSGAEAVMTAQTGFPAAVDFARGYPRYQPHTGAAGVRLARGEVDAALVVGAAALVPPELLAMLARTSCGVVGPHASDGPLGAAAAVAVDGGVAGIHDGGTALRMDDVPLPLRPSVSGPPATAALVRAVAERVRRALGRGDAGRLQAPDTVGAAR